MHEIKLIKIRSDHNFLRKCLFTKLSILPTQETILSRITQNGYFNMIPEGNTGVCKQDLGFPMRRTAPPKGVSVSYEKRVTHTTHRQDRTQISALRIENATVILVCQKTNCRTPQRATVCWKRSLDDHYKVKQSKTIHYIRFLLW